MKKYWKITIAVLFALAVALGLLQSQSDSFFVFKNQKSEIVVSDQSLRGYYEKSLGLAGQNQNISTASFLAVGDIMLSRNVASKIKQANDPLLPFSAMADIFNQVDFAIGNLESPFSGSDYIPPTGSLVFNAPDENITGLKQSKFKVLSLANNHALDQGLDGLERTIEFLAGNGIQKTGAAFCHPERPQGVEGSLGCLNEAWQPAMVEQNGIKICFLAASYASINDGGKTTNDFVARIDDLENLQATIYKLQANCDFIALSMHAGTEYVRKPNQAQIDFAHAAINAGADIVIGHHPHWMQSIEKYCPQSHLTSSSQRKELTNNSPPLQVGTGVGNCKYIFYSLGNFIFDQMWSQETREGLTLKIQISKSKFQNELQGSKVPAQIDSIELMPVIIDNYSTPRPANEEEAKKILQNIGLTEFILK